MTKKPNNAHSNSKASNRKLRSYCNTILKQAEEMTLKMKIKDVNIKDELLITAPPNQLEFLEKFGLTYSITSLENLELLEQSKEYMNEVFNLTKENMQHIYDQCNFLNIGWNDDSKQNELSQKGTHYLIINSKSSEHNDSIGSSKNIVAFLQFMYLIDEYSGPLKPVCYILELQIYKTYQSYGLGKLMIDIIERLSKEMNLHKLLCTVQTSNPRALKFYLKNCSFSEDESNPAFPTTGDLLSKIDGLGSYVILKKCLIHENSHIENIEL